MHSYSSHAVQPARQSGVVLVVALVMLLLITIVGVSAVKTLTLEERMTSNSIDRNTVFQTTEWGLSLAEQVAESQAKQCNSGFVNGGGVPTDTTTSESNGNGNGNGNGNSGGSTSTSTCTPTTCQNGLCGYPQPNCTPRWEDSSFTGWASVKDPDDASKNLVTPAGVTPQFIIEYLNPTFNPQQCVGKPTPGVFLYRITVRTAAGEGRGSVTLQSVYGQ